MLKIKALLVVLALAFAGAGLAAEVLPAPRDITYMSSNNLGDYKIWLRTFDGRNTTGTFRFPNGVIENSDFTKSTALNYSYFRNTIGLNNKYDGASFNYSDMQGGTWYNGSAKNITLVGANLRGFNILGMDLSGIAWKRYNIGGVEPVYVLADITDRRMQPNTIYNSFTTCPNKKPAVICDIFTTEKGFGWYLRERKTGK